MGRDGHGHYFADSQLALVNVREELVLKKQEVGGVLFNLNAECLREKPQLPDKKILASLLSKKFVWGRRKNSTREIAQLCVTAQMIDLWELHSYPLSL